MFALRPFHPSDLPALYRICLQTGAAGQDASHLYCDAELLGHYYAGPYACLEPELCWVLTHVGEPCGYILGCADSQTFAQQSEQHWFQQLRQRYPLEPQRAEADQALVKLIHQGYQLPPLQGELLAAYPAHLHIDLLPIAQGQGQGRSMIDTLLNALRKRQVPGIHLGVSNANSGALAFYQRLGFAPLYQGEDWQLLGKSL